MLKSSHVFLGFGLAVVLWGAFELAANTGPAAAATRQETADTVGQASTLRLQGGLVANVSDMILVWEDAQNGTHEGGSLPQGAMGSDLASILAANRTPAAPATPSSPTTDSTKTPARPRP